MSNIFRVTTITGQEPYNPAYFDTLNQAISESNSRLQVLGSGPVNQGQIDWLTNIASIGSIGDANVGDHEGLVSLAVNPTDLPPDPNIIKDTLISDSGSSDNAGCVTDSDKGIYCLPPAGDRRTPPPPIELPKLCDPELQLCQDWYVELDCPDFNVDCCKGIDDLQNIINVLYESIKDLLLNNLTTVEQNIANYITNISNIYNESIQNIEYGIKNIYDTIIFNQENKIQIITDQIRQLCEKDQIIDEDIFQEKEKTPDKECTILASLDAGNGTRFQLKSCCDKVEKEPSQVLSECCKQPQPFIIKFDPEQLTMILDAIRSLQISTTHHKTTIQNAENVVCEDDYPSELSYELSTCYDKDLIDYQKRTDFETKYEDFRQRNVKPIPIIPEN